MATPASAEAQPCSRRPEASTCWLNKRIERAASAATGAGRWAQRGARAGGPPPWRSAKATPANGRPPRAPPPQLAVAQAGLDSAHSDAARPWPSATVWVATGSISTCLSRCGDPTSGAGGRPTPPRGTPNAAAQAGILASQEPDGSLSPQETADLGMAGWPANCGLQREGRAADVLQRAPGPLCPAAGGGPRVGAR